MTSSADARSRPGSRQGADRATGAEANELRTKVSRGYAGDGSQRREPKNVRAPPSVTSASSPQFRFHQTATPEWRQVPPPCRVAYFASASDL